MDVVHRRSIIGLLACPSAALAVSDQARAQLPPPLGGSAGYTVAYTSPTAGRAPDGSLIQEAVALNGQPLLDNHYPLEPPPRQGEGSNLVSKTDADGTRLSIGDSPSQTVTSDCVALEVTDQFTIWVMYRPPSPSEELSSVYTPLVRADWHWSVSVAKGNDGFAIVSSDSGHGPFVTGAHPTWQAYFAGGLVWITLH